MAKNSPDNLPQNENISETPERKENNNENETEVQKVLSEIAQAAGNALQINKFEDRQRRIDQVARDLRIGKKLNKEDIDFFSKDSWPNEVKFPNFEIMTESFLRIGLNKELIDEIIDHEKAHFDAAVKKGLKPIIIIKFYKLESGAVQFLPAIKTGFKENDAKTPENIKDVASAPVIPSPSDMNKIK